MAVGLERSRNMQGVEVGPRAKHANRTSPVISCMLDFADDLSVISADRIAEQPHLTTDELFEFRFGIGDLPAKLASRDGEEVTVEHAMAADLEAGVGEAAQITGAQARTSLVPEWNKEGSCHSMLGKHLG